MQYPETLFTQHRRVVLQDTDAAGIVYTPRVAHFVVEVVESWFGDRLSIDLKLDSPRMVFASLSCTFLSPIRPTDTLEIRVALCRIGRSSLGFEVVGHRLSDDRLCWMAETVCVFVDRDTLKSQSIPGNLHEALEAEAALAVRLPFADRTLAP